MSYVCACVQVWKDVDGVLTSDPRIVSGAQPVNELTYEEATELAFFGAQVRCSSVVGRGGGGVGPAESEVGK